LDDGRRQTGEAALRLVARPLVVGARQAEHGDRRRLGLDREIGEHVLHERLVGEKLPEGGAVGAVVGRLRDRLAHRGRRADHAVEAGVGYLLYYGWAAAPLLAHHSITGAPEPR